MPVNSPTKPPDSPTNKAAEESASRFHPEMPQIPGLSGPSRPAQRGLVDFDSQRLLQIAGVVAVAVLLGGAIVWRFRSKPQPAEITNPIAEVAEPAAPEETAQSSAMPVLQVPGVAATVEELSKPWAWKKFTFVKPLTQESIDAMVIRLPSGSLWAFSLQVPYSRCELEFVTNPAAISAQYGYRATHPMVVSPCDSTIYDPLKVGPLGANTWARGEIVQGSSLRPPISIDVKVQGSSIIADSIE
jgi:hypothetical protein